MSSVVISGDTSGAITLSAPAVSGTNTATLPAATGTVMVSGNMPAFSAYKSSSQSISSGTLTKITFTSEQFDTNNNFASSTFTPTVAGYYQINAMLNSIDASTSATVTAGYIYKNGVRIQDGFYMGSAGKISFGSIVYCNGTTDYIEIYAVVNAVSAGIYGAASDGQSWFNGSLVRAA